MIRKITNSEVNQFAFMTAVDIGLNHTAPKVYPIPRGGIPAAYAVKTHMSGMTVVDSPEEATIFIDDLIDSGATQDKYAAQYPGKPFYALLDKRTPSWKQVWIVWPWEETAESSIEDNILRLLEYVGEDVSREGLKETPKRVAKAWREWCSGYFQKPEDILKTFIDGADGCDEMVIQKDIPFYSHCEHHLAPFFGTVTIAYIPSGKIVGLSKLARLSDIYAKRLQVQERYTNQIANALMDNLQPKGVGVVVRARHLCIESRGVDKQGHYTVTSALRGVMRSLPEARAEFLSLAR
jgi:GTP cyclohydrolase I